METDPLSVFLVKSDSKGDRLLFKYPFLKRPEIDPISPNSSSTPSVESRVRRRVNPFAIVSQEPPPPTLDSGGSFPDELLSNLFAVKQELCGAKFELKVNNVRFVGHPTLVHPCTRRGKSLDRPIILINVVFALQAPASHSIVKCYYELSKRLGVALRHEERRCGYVNQEVMTMTSLQDDRPEDADLESYDAFEIMLGKSSLAKDLRKIYNDLCTLGLVQMRVNRWIYLGFCLPQKVHQLHNKELRVCPESIDRCLESIRPYHGLLLLVETSSLLDSLVPDASPALTRLIKIYSPLKSLQTLSADADLTLTQVFNLTSHLVYWGKAIIVYPLCESNVYMTAPNANVHSKSHLIEKFAEQFPAQNLIQVIAEFSLPISISQRASPLSSTENDVHVIIWLLQHRLILQLHTYVYYMPTCRGSPFQDNSSGTSGTKSEGSVYDASTPSETLSLSGGESGSETSDEGLELRMAAWESEDYLSRLSPEERRTIVNTPASPSQIKLLIRLIQQNYFQGDHHLEDIMYTENLRRSQLLQILDKFREILITCESEDPALAMFYPHTYL